VPRFSVAAAPATTRADIIVHAVSPAGSPLVALGGAIPVRGVALRDGTADLDVPLVPGKANDLTVEAAIGGSIKSMSVRVHQDIAATSRGVLAGRVAAVDGQSIAGALVSYGASTTHSDVTGYFELAHLPKGQVAAVVTASGYSPGFAIGTVAATWAGLTTDTRLPALPAERVVGSDGATFHGEGWTVTVPPGALTTPQAIRVGALPYSGLVDQLGQPIVQITPVGLRFAKPVTVTVDAGTVGPHLDTRTVLAVDPATLRSDHPPTVNTNATGYSVTITNPAQIRVLGTDTPQDPTQCKPYSTNDDPAAKLNAVRQKLQPFMTTFIHEPAAWQLYDMYLTPGETNPNPSPIEFTDAAALDEFKTAPETTLRKLDVIAKLVDQLKAKPPPLRAPTDPAGGDLAQFKLGQDQDINWTNYWTTPGLIAGSSLAGSSLGGAVEDDRHITGQYQIIPDVTKRGVLRAVTLRERKLKLDVHDSVDFCPGDLGSSVEQVVTVSMSRLEVTPHPFGGTYAKPILYHLSTPLTSEPADLTPLYHKNDPDHDDSPDTQPWPGAPYKLDNCPGTFNPEQTDSDGDGVGDACRGSVARVPIGFTGRGSGSINMKDTSPLDFTLSITGRSYPKRDCQRAPIRAFPDDVKKALAPGSTPQTLLYCQYAHFTITGQQTACGQTIDLNSRNILPYLSLSGPIQKGYFVIFTMGLPPVVGPHCNWLWLGMPFEGKKLVPEGQRSTVLHLSNGPGTSGSLTITWRY
jgi:hypothetical protein